MAITITSTQVQFPSNGNMEGFYTGGSYANTSYPLGQYLIAYNSTLNSTAVRQTTYTIYTPPPTNQLLVGLITPWAAGASVIAGTWRCRGCVFTALGASRYDNTALMQRVA